SSPLASRLMPSEYQQLSKVEGIKDLTAIVICAIKTKQTSYFLIVGTSALEPLLNSLSLIEGRLFHRGKKEVLLGRKALKGLNLTINESIELAENDKFLIVGTFVTGSRLIDKGAVLNLQPAMKLLKRGEDVNLALVHIAEGYQPEKIKKDISKSFPSLSVMKSRDLLSEIKLFQVVESFSWGISAIALIIACIFVMNTLMMSVYERTKEIGILMALGWSRWMITKTIFFESIIVCLIGGIFGDILGFMFIYIFSVSNITGLDWTYAALSPTIIVYSIILALILGVVSAVHPAIVVSRLSPAQAIRYE
ncbi:MAG: ABC transporter permease, partial [Deltaproteobacteria bacterium]|nr:ABC transporter permease [Deltaproteobacteria bacterium]